MNGKMILISFGIFLLLFTASVTALAAGKLTAKQICLNGSCIVAWGTGGTGNVTGVFTNGFLDNNASIGDILISLASDFNTGYNSRFSAWLYSQVPTDFNTAYTSRFDLNSLVTARVIAGTGVTVSGNGKGDVTISATGTGGGGFDQNVYSIGIMGKDFNQFLIDGNFFNKNVYASSFTGSGSGLSGIPFVAITDNNAQIKSLFSGSYPIVFSNGNYSLGNDINSWYQSRNAVILYAMLPTDFNTAYTSRFDLNGLVTARVIAGTGVTVSGNGKGDVTISATGSSAVTGIFGSTYIDTNSATGDVKLTLNTYIPSEANIDANALGVVNSLDLNNSLSYIKTYNNLLRTYTGAWFITVNNDANTISPATDFNTGYQSRNATILNAMLPPDYNNQYNSKFAVWLYTQVPADFNSAYGSKFDLNKMYNQIIDSNDVGRLKSQVIADMNKQYTSRFDFNILTERYFDINASCVDCNLGTAVQATNIYATTFNGTNENLIGDLQVDDVNVRTIQTRSIQFRDYNMLTQTLPVLDPLLYFTVEDEFWGDTLDTKWTTEEIGTSIVTPSIYTVDNNMGLMRLSPDNVLLNSTGIFSRYTRPFPNKGFAVKTKFDQNAGVISYASLVGFMQLTTTGANVFGQQIVIYCNGAVNNGAYVATIIDGTANYTISSVVSCQGGSFAKTYLVADNNVAYFYIDGNYIGSVQATTPDWNFTMGLNPMILGLSTGAGRKDTFVDYAMFYMRRGEYD